MKKRIARVLALTLLLPLTLLFFAFALPPQYGDTYLAALNDKARLLEETPSPKIVLIGGSGAAFDFDCALLEARLPGCRAVNFGLYAGLGTAVMLELALPSLRAGDTVIFSPELSAQTLSDWFSAESMWQAAEETPALLFRLNFSRWGRLLAALPAYAAQKARFFLTGAPPEGSGVYARSAFTEKGDVERSLRPANQMPSAWDPNAPLRFDPSLPTADFIARVNEFAARCESRGVRVCFRFCPMNAAALEEGEEERIAAFEARLREELNCEIIGSAEEALMEPGWFFDTNFHLNGAGAAVSTALLAEELSPLLDVSSAAPLSLPSMPETAAAQALDGENGDEDCFVYAPQKEGWAVAGLTETGAARESLTVPVTHGGLPVLSIAQGAFSGNSQLERLTMQSNIRVIADRAFEGCPALKTIALLQDDPGRCTVGPRLLVGTGADVAVPAERYGRYCTNYFWSVHAARLRPMDEPPAAAASPVPSPSPAPRSAGRIRYEGNGGALRSGAGDALTRELSYAHLRENTLQGTVWFQREGYLLTGWSTRPDGGGQSVGLGSRIDPRDASTLYAQWLPCAPDGDFSWETEGGSAVIAGYHGAGDICALPQTHEGLPVRKIRADAFREKHFSLLALSPSLRTVEAEAFSDCEIDSLLLYDNLTAVTDASFSACRGPHTLRINAATAPVYSASYFGAFQDKYDYLLSLGGRKKLLLCSGSSGRYGYDSALLKSAFPDCEPVNMGVYAYTNALPQLRLILPLTEAGDMVLYAPEFDAAAEQFCAGNRLDTGFWAMMEENYDCLAALEMDQFSCVFDSLGEYLSIRSRMPARDYADSPAHYDDDGNDYAFSTYNQYGDFILPRPNGDCDGRLRHNIADYTAESFPPEMLQSLNNALSPFLEKGAAVFFTYTPRNVNSLTEESTPEARRALHEHLKRHLACPVISDIEDFLLPGRYFWLIDSHTSTEGARIRTQRVIRDLREALAAGP